MKPRWFARLAVGLLACLSWGLATAAPDTVLAIGTEASQPLGAYIGLLDDPSGSLDLTAVLRADAAGKFRPLRPPTPGLGFRPGATWLRFALANPSSVSQERWLHVDWVFQQSYTLYLIDAQGHGERMESGTQIPIARRPLASRLMLFPIRLAAAESKTGYLRIAGRAATVVDLTLWQPVALLDRLTLVKTVKYLLIGCVEGTVAVFSFQIFQARRRPKLLALIPAQVLSLLIALWMDGLALDWLPADESFWLTRGLFTMVFLAFFFQAIFAKEFLELAKRQPWLDRVMLGLAVCCMLLAVLPLFEVFPRFNHYAILAVTGLLAWAYFAAAGQKGGLGFTYLVVCGGFCFTIFIQVAQNLGWLTGVHSKDLWLFGLAISGLAMAYALYRDIESVRLKSQAAQVQLLAQKQGESERLARAVEASTAELRVTMRKAEAANQAKSAFLSMVSHEFRTPLHIILGYAGLLGKHAEGDMSEKLSLIEKSGAQLLHLIEKVLNFSRGEQSMALDAGPVSLTALAAYLEHAGQILAAKKHNRFSVELPPNLPEAVETDERRLTQVLLNLIDNACKYTERGRIVLRLERVAGTPGQASGRKHWLRFEVEDDGIGIAKADQALVFESFNRGSNGHRQPGVGLGLAIARQIVRAMGSDIGLDSGPGRGSRFYFTLCLAETAEPCPAAAPTGRITGYAGPRQTLLVVDDMATNRLLLAELCRVLGFAVVTAADGEEAAACCREADPPIAAALVDQFMPGSDGWAFLKAVRLNPHLAHLPVVLVSATSPERPEDFPTDMDFDGVMTKPTTLEQLAETLASALPLEWLREAASAKPSAVGQPVALPAEKLAEFSNMLALGQVVALRRWAEALAVSDPDCAELAGQIKRFSQAIDLQGLKKLLEQVSAVSRPGAA